MYIITGGGSGIGRALAHALVQRGKSVLIVGRREASLQETAASSSLIDYVCADVSNASGLDKITEHCAALPRIDGLINNAGTLEPIGSVKNITAQDWQQAFNTNLNPALFLSQKLYDKLSQGRVLNISSGAAHFAIKGWAAYCVSKAALSMLTRCFQEESDSVAFASVMPGIIDTNMQAMARSDKNMDPYQHHFYNKLKQDNRLISVETVAAFLSWLLLDIDKQDYVAKEWDIYDVSHHKHWLKPPHQVLHWDY